MQSDLAQIVSLLWQEGIEPVVLGGGSNVLVSDKGIRGVTVINRAKDVRFDEGAAPSVWAESGVVFSNLANRCALKGLAGTGMGEHGARNHRRSSVRQRGRLRWRHGRQPELGGCADQGGA